VPPRRGGPAARAAPAGDPATAGPGRAASAAYTVALPAPPAQAPPRVPPGDPLLLSAEPGAAPLRCAVLLSGGVDSSVALALAQAAGHHVEAFYLQIWFQEDFRNFWGQCPWEEDLAYCKETCQQLGVPLHVPPLVSRPAPPPHPPPAPPAPPALARARPARPGPPRPRPRRRTSTGSGW